LLALALSFIVHGICSLTVWYYPLVATAIGFRDIEFVDEEYDRVILLDFSKKLNYPLGYAGFHAPEKTLSPEEMKKEEARQRRREEARRRAKEREAAQREADEKATAEQLASAQPAIIPAPTPTPPSETYPGGFGKINTAPIRDQVQRLYDAHKAGKLVLPAGSLRVGVSGQINRDGSLSKCKIIVPSGLDEIDRAALAILDAVSVSRALGPLAEMTSLSLILTIGDRAELSVVGFANSDQAAANIVNLANAAILFARFKKSDDPAAMIMINNLKVSRSGQRVQALISMPRQTASDSLAKTMGKP
jgi:hypothetical protein